MYFQPVVLPELFSEEDQARLRELLDSKKYSKSWLDRAKSRGVKKFPELEEYFSKKIELIAREVFGDPTLKTTYSVYLDYNKPTSALPPHRDNNACTYTIDYNVSARTPWGLQIEGEEFHWPIGDGLAFMGGFDSHSRLEMPDPENNRVEVIMFHFAPADHWYFTEGPDYLYVLQEQGKLRDFDSYELSPKRTKNL
jgi:hypothetical protein